MSSAPSVLELVMQAVGGLQDVATAQLGGETEIRRGSVPFAAVDGEHVAILLRPDIAEAALNTPQTSPSRRGTAWIAFEPDVSVPSDVDRLRAWLTIGWRSAQRHN